jgi:hypothetical protein
LKRLGARVENSFPTLFWKPISDARLQIQVF